jgi:hypothetical protein
MKAWILLTLLFTVHSVGAQDRPVAYVHGKPVMASQLKGASDKERAEHLATLVVMPALRAHMEPHQHLWMATEDDIRRFTEAERAHALCQPADREPRSPEQLRDFALFVVPHLKLQRFIYDRHGGGRLRFQQMGTEAFDATRQMLLDLERKGAFSIPDAALRQQVLGYYLEPRGPLMDDPGPDKAFRIEHYFDPCPAR